MRGEPHRAGEAARAFLALGSNLGDRLSAIQQAVDLLSDAGIELFAASRVYETEPVGPPQPAYLNAVVEVRTTLGPRELLEAGLDVERRLGRVRGERWGPRVIDVDVLTYGRLTIEEPGLTVPHPRMHERAFVLVPLSELDPDPPLPGGRRLGTVRLGPDALTGVRLFAPPPAIGRPGEWRSTPGITEAPEA